MTLTRLLYVMIRIHKASTVCFYPDFTMKLSRFPIVKKERQVYAFNKFVYSPPAFQRPVSARVCSAKLYKKFYTNKYIRQLLTLLQKFALAGDIPDPCMPSSPEAYI